MKTVLKVFAIALIVGGILFITKKQDVPHQPADNYLNNSTLRFDGPAKFAGVHSLIRTRYGDDVPRYKVGDQLRAMEKAKALLDGRKNAPLNWVERGPANVGGRTRGLIVDPSDATNRTWYAGSAGGGVWRTTNAGGSWELLTEEIGNLSTSSLAMSANNTDVIYAGTGEGFGNIDGINGSGVWKSVDQGETWSALASTVNNQAFGDITRLMINPADENEILASTIGERTRGQRSSYIMKSTDGGSSWQEKYVSNNGRIQQILYVPGDYNTQYATINSVGVFQSLDAGETWNQVFDASNTSIRRIEMAVSRLDGGVAYLACESGSGSQLYHTRDTFNTISKTVFDARQPDWLGRQGWYDNTIAVHPYNDSMVWVAGAGSMLEIKTGTDSVRVKVFGGFFNETSFLTDVEDSQFLDESGGSADGLVDGLPYSTGIVDSDRNNVVVYFGPDREQKAHLIDVDLNTFSFTFGSMIDVPFEAWDTMNNRQIALTVFDLDADGQWSYKDYTDLPGAFQDITMINALDYSEAGDSDIQGANPFYKALYYFSLQRDTSYQGDEWNFPEGQLSFLTRDDEGVLGDGFRPVTDGYFEYTDIDPVGSKTVHVDHHNIIFMPLDDAEETFYVLNANDGGVAFSEDNGETFIQTGETFSDGMSPSSYGYNVTQFYGLDKMNGASRYIGGTQDNGTWVSGVDPDETSIWIDAPSGDGFECAWHYENTDLVLETSQFNNLYKSYDGGNDWTQVPLPGGQGPFISRVAASQIDADLVFMVAEDGVLKSTDFGDTWRVIDMPDSWAINNWGPPIEISLADPNMVWTGRGMNGDDRIMVSSDKGETFTEASLYPDATMGVMTGVATHPLESETAYALFSQADGPKILKTEDLGQTWTDISGFVSNVDESNNGYPDVATYCLLVMPWDVNWMWAGTEIGLFESRDGGATWQWADNGLPAMSIWEMKIVGDEVVLASHGRGIWSLDVSEINTVNTEDLDHESIASMSVFPNPMSSTANISYSLKANENVNIVLHNTEGQQVKKLFSGKVSAGEQQLTIDRKGILPGVYFVSLQTRSGKATRKLYIE